MLPRTKPQHNMSTPRPRPIFSSSALLLLSFLAAAAAGDGDQTPTPTCVPSLQRLLSCLDFIEHRTDEIPVPCCIQVRTTVAEQPCCIMHVIRGNVAKLMGPGYDNARAMVNVTAACLADDDASVLVDITRNCSGKAVPPLTPEFTFTTRDAAVPPSVSSGATRLQGSSSSTSTSLPLVASFVVYGAVALLQN